MLLSPPPHIADLIYSLVYMLLPIVLLDDHWIDFQLDCISARHIVHAVVQKIEDTQQAEEQG